MMSSCFIQNFGCRVNEAEACSWAEELERGGMRLEDDPAQADWVVINTCALTAKADRDVRKFIRRVPRINPGAKLVIAGCSIEAGNLRDEVGSAEVVLLSNVDKMELPGRILHEEEFPGSNTVAEKARRSRALLKVQDGCDQRCTFCIIPFVRGPSRSLDRAEVIGRASQMVNRGFREIVLCGIHLSSYGFDLAPLDSLMGLLGGLLEIPGLGKLRLSSLDPRSLDEGFIRLITGSARICPHFHLSLQHGSDRILKRMGRGSSSADYRRVLERLRESSPAAALGADIIVGFPGEEETGFDELHDFLMESPLDYLHVFSYSPRPGTPAAEWPQVADTEKRRRSARLRRFSADRRRAFRQRFLGQTLDAIVIRKKGSSGELLTSNYIEVRIPHCSRPPGGEVKVRITRLESEWAEGEEVA